MSDVSILKEDGITGLNTFFFHRVNARAVRQVTVLFYSVCLAWGTSTIHRDFLFLFPRTLHTSCTYIEFFHS